MKSAISYNFSATGSSDGMVKEPSTSEESMKSSSKLEDEQSDSSSNIETANKSGDAMVAQITVTEGSITSNEECGVYYRCFVY